MKSTMKSKEFSRENIYRGDAKNDCGRQKRCRGIPHVNRINLISAKFNKEYIIKRVETNDQEMKRFLFTLGCYEGEKITIISIIANHYVVVIKDARYSIDSDLARCIIL